MSAVHEISPEPFEADTLPNSLVEMVADRCGITEAEARGRLSDLHELMVPAHNAASRLGLELAVAVPAEITEQG